MKGNEIHIQYPGNKIPSASNKGRVPLPRHSIQEWSSCLIVYRVLEKYIVWDPVNIHNRYEIHHI